MSGSQQGARTPRTLAVADVGGATASVALLGQVDGRWRLLGGLAAPAGAPVDVLCQVVAARIAAVDPELARDLEIGANGQADFPWLRSRSHPPATLLVLAATRRAVGLLESEAVRTGWRCVSASTETHDPREMTALALRPDVGAILIGAGDPPGPDERSALDDLAALGAAVAHRREDLPIVLAGAMRGRGIWGEASRKPDAEAAASTSLRPVEAPAVSGRRGAGADLRAVLDGLLAEPDDGRQALRRSAESLADLLDRRVELVEIGLDGGTRVLAEPGVAGADPSSQAIVTVVGALVPTEADDATVDGVLSWTTGGLDRHRMADRLRDLRAHPWADASGDGARLRLAAASAALMRLAAVTPEFGLRPAPDVTVVAGGAFATAPPAAIALAVAGTIRRTGATQIAFDHARLLGPIGTIEDAAERRALLADLVVDALVPLGTVVVAGGLGVRSTGRRRDRVASGRVHLASDETPTTRDLVAGGLAFLPLAPGSVAEARFEFEYPVHLGRQARRMTVPVTGGLAGLVVDLRDVPMRLPERRDRRRTIVADWSAMSWPRDER